jgi:hypothetical protein
VTAFALERDGETAPFIGEALEALRRHADGQTETPMVMPIPQSEGGEEPHDVVHAVGSKGPARPPPRLSSRDARGVGNTE